MKNEISRSLEQTEKNLREALNAFAEKQLNEVPLEGSWTPAQVVDHILKSQSNFPQPVSSNLSAAGRNPEEKKEAVKKLFLDFTIKM